MRPGTVATKPNPGDFEMRVTAKRKNGKQAEVDYEFGTDLASTTALFGEEIVFNHAIGALKVAFQGWLRSQLDQDKTDEQIAEAATNWKPGQRKQGKTPQEKLRDQLNAMSPEERALVLRDFKAAAKEAKAA